MTGVALASAEVLTREEWLELRRTGVGGSDVAAILGLDPYKSAYEVWLDKTGIELADDAGAAAGWGTRLEPVIADHFAAETGLHVRRHPVVVQDPSRPHALANVDRLVAEAENVQAHALLECKSTGAYLAHRWENGCADYAALQAYHYLDVTGLDRAYVAVLIGGNDYRHFLLERDDELMAAIRESVDLFWQSVLDKVPPPVDGSKRTRELLEALHPSSEPATVVDLSDRADEVLELRRQHTALKATAKSASDQAEAIANQLRAWIGDAEGVVVDGEVIATWRTQSRAEHTVPAWTGRVLRVRKEKDK